MCTLRVKHFLLSLNRVTLHFSADKEIEIDLPIMTQEIKGKTATPTDPAFPDL